MNGSEKTLLAFIVGAAVGGVAGLLFAPAKGKKTRKKLAQKANELRDELSENWDSDKMKSLGKSALTEVEKYGKKLTKTMKH